jgi:hypothetical protein
VFFNQVNYGAFLITYLSPDALAAFRLASPGAFAGPFKRRVLCPTFVPLAIRDRFTANQDKDTVSPSSYSRLRQSTNSSSRNIDR